MSFRLEVKGKSALPTRPESWKNAMSQSTSKNAVSDFTRAFSQHIGFITARMTTETISALTHDATDQAALVTKDIVALMNALKYKCMLGDDPTESAVVDFKLLLRDPHVHGFEQRVAGFIKGLNRLYDDFSGAA